MPMTLKDIIATYKHDEFFVKKKFLKYIKRDSYEATKKFNNQLANSLGAFGYLEELTVQEAYLTYKENFYNSITQTIITDYEKLNVNEMYDLEILNWIDDEEMEEGNFNTEYDCYVEYGNGEAQDVIYTDMITYWQNTHNKGKELSSQDHTQVQQRLEDHYQL